MMNTFSMIRQGAPIILAKADQVCDKIPLLSTLTNLIDLVAKGILLYTGTTPSLWGKSWSEHIAQKPIWKCLLLCVPILGNIIVYFIPHKNNTQKVIDELFGVSNVFERLPEININGEDLFKQPQAMTSAVMKGLLADGRPFIAIRLKHEAEPMTEEKPIDMQQELFRYTHPQFFEFEKVYMIYQRDLSNPNIWYGFDDPEHCHLVPYFFGGSITDFEDGHVRGFEQEYYSLLQSLIQKGAGKDPSEHEWKVVGHEAFKQEFQNKR